MRSDGDRKRSWLKVTIKKGDFDQYDMIEYVNSIGCTGLEEKETKFFVYFPQKISDGVVESLVKYLGDKKHLTDSTIIDEEDWHLNWMKDFNIINLTERITIRPYWEKAEVKSDIDISIKPGMAFGTGTHETTQIALILLEQFLKPGSLMLDAGCGNGILTIAALKMGVRYVDCWDIDPYVLTSFNDNIELNNIKTGYTFNEGDVTELEHFHYDLVVSNIEKRVNLRLLSLISKSDKDILTIYSGLIAEDRTEFCEQVEKCGNRIINEISRNEWIGFVVG